MKILLINQNATVEKLVKLSAQKVGLEVEAVESIEGASATEYKWVLIDHENLATLNAEAIREQFAGAKAGLLYPKNGEKTDGFDLYIEKPFLPTELIDEFSSQMGSGDAASDELGMLDMDLPDLDDNFADLPTDLDDGLTDSLSLDDEISDDLSLDDMGSLDSALEEKGSVLDKEELEKVKGLLEDDEIPSDLGDELSLDENLGELAEISSDPATTKEDDLSLDDDLGLDSALDESLDISSDLGDELSLDDDLGESLDVPSDLGSDELSFDENLGELEEISSDSVATKEDELSLDDDLGLDSALDESLDISSDLGDELSLDDDLGEFAEISSDPVATKEDDLSLDDDLGLDTTLDESLDVSSDLGDELSLEDDLGESDSSDLADEGVKLDLGNNTALLDEDDLMDLHKESVAGDELLDEFDEIGSLEEMDKNSEIDLEEEASEFDFTEQPSDELETLDENSLAIALGEEVASKPQVEEKLDEPSPQELPVSQNVVQNALGNLSTNALKEILNGMQLTINISFPDKK